LRLSKIKKNKVLKGTSHNIVQSQKVKTREGSHTSFKLYFRERLLFSRTFELRRRKKCLRRQNTFPIRMHVGWTVFYGFIFYFSLTTYYLTFRFINQFQRCQMSFISTFILYFLTLHQYLIFSGF
jgi:hypothetical protein